MRFPVTTPPLIVEGEKARDAAAESIPDVFVTTWPGGTNHAGNIDLTPLQGRDVILWPDADVPGRKAMDTIASNLAGIASSVRLVDVSAMTVAADAADVDERTTAEMVANAKGIARQSYWPEPVDVAAMARIDPTPPQFIIDDWLPCGYATLMAGHGGAGKSNIALYLSACIATGTPFFGLETAQRRILYLSCEDRTDVLHWRLSRIVQHAELEPETLASGLSVLDLVGHDALLWRRDPMTGTNTTAAYAELVARIEASAAELLIVDGVADAYGGNENDRGEVKQFVNALVGIMPAHGGVLLQHHVNKPSATTGATAEGYSGSTAWHNSARARWYLYPETTQTDEGAERSGDMLLELQKSNLGRADQYMRFRWDDDAHLFVGELERANDSEFERCLQERTEQEGIVEAIREVRAGGDYVPAAQTGNRTALHVLKSTDALPNSLRNRGANKRFWRHIERLRRIGQIRVGEIKRASRHKTETLEPADTGAAGAASNASNAFPESPAESTQGAPAPHASNAAGGPRGAAHAHSGWGDAI